MTIDGLVIQPGAGGVRLGIRVVTRASRSAVSGVRDGRLVVRVTAPPVEGAANDAVLTVLAGTLGIPRRSVSIITGETHREKTVVIAGLTDAAVRERLRRAG